MPLLNLNPAPLDIQIPVGDTFSIRCTFTEQVQGTVDAKLYDDNDTVVQDFVVTTISDDSDGTVVNITLPDTSEKIQGKWWVTTQSADFKTKFGGDFIIGGRNARPLPSNNESIIISESNQNVVVELSGAPGPRGLSTEWRVQGEWLQQSPKGLNQWENVIRIDELYTGFTRILGSLEDTGDLPSEAEAGDAYLIPNASGVDEVWVWIETSFLNVGPFRGADGVDGKDAYQEWLDQGNTGSRQDFIDFLQGEDGQTPYIQNGTWWIGDTNTGVTAIGQDGQDGNTPYIQNGTWWIGQTDTGVTAIGQDGQDGREVEFRVENGILQERYEGEAGWRDVYNLEEYLSIDRFPPFILNSQITTTVTDSQYTVQINKAVDNATPPIGLVYRIVEGTFEQLTSNTLIRQRPVVAQVTNTTDDVINFTVQRGQGFESQVGAYVLDENNNISLYSPELVTLLDPEILDIEVNPVSINGNIGASGSISWTVIDNGDTTGDQDLATPSSSNTDRLTLSNIDKNAGTADYQLVGSGIGTIDIVADLDGFTTSIPFEVSEFQVVDGSTSETHTFDVV